MHADYANVGELLLDASAHMLDFRHHGLLQGCIDHMVTGDNQAIGSHDDTGTKSFGILNQDHAGADGLEDDGGVHRK